jgi:hypothetical protein
VAEVCPRYPKVPTQPGGGEDGEGRGDVSKLLVPVAGARSDNRCAGGQGQATRRGERGSAA